MRQRSIALLAALTGALIGVVLAAPARAGTFYVFGDSLADNGNLPRVYGIPFSLIEGGKAKYYDDGRFSNGPVWAEYLPGLVGLSFATGDDRAVGGSFTGPITVNGKTYGNLINAAGLPGELPTFDQQVAQFAAAGEHFAGSDVAGVWIGANNYFYLGEPADPARRAGFIDAEVGQAVAQTQSGLAALIGLGARTLIVQNLPPLGDTPSYNTGSAASVSFWNTLSATHDAALARSVAGLHAATGANIILVNEAQLFDELLANRAAFGKINVTDACVDTPACANAGTAAQNSYLFWDSVHPTTGTHFVIAEYAAADLESLRGLAVPAQLAALGGEDFNDALDGRIADLRYGADGLTIDLPQQGVQAQLGGSDAVDDAGGDAGPKLAGFLTGSYDYGGRKNNDFNNGFSYDVGTVTGGLDDRLADGVAAGIAFGYGTDHATVAQDGTVAVDAYQLGVYAGVTRPHYYVNGVFALGLQDYTTRRPGVILGDTRASPTGRSYDISVDAGATERFGGLIAGPVAGISAAQVSLDGYSESGDPALTQTVQGQTYQRDILDAGFAAETSVQMGDAVLNPQLRAVVDDLVSGNGGSFASEFSDEPLVLLTSRYTSGARYWGDISAGLAANVTARLSVAAKFETTIGKADGNDHAVSGSLRYLF